MKKLLATLLSVVLIAPGCATTAGGSRTAAPGTAPDPGLLSVYVRQLPIGARVRADRVDGTAVRGILMAATARSIVVQPRTRIPEAPVEVPIAELRRVELQPPTSLGKSMAVGIVSGVGGVLAVFLLLAAIYSD